MWFQVANTALGLWLMASPAVLGYAGAASTNDRIFGPIAATLAAVAITEATRPVRWANLPIGLWMVLAPWTLGFDSAASIVNSTLVGLGMAALSYPAGRVEEHFGGGWAVVFRGTGAGRDG